MYLLIGLVLSWKLIYKRQRYQQLVEQHHSLRKRQRLLRKVIDKDSKNTQPEKIEFTSNYETLKYLKKELFKARMIANFIVGLCMLFIMRILFWLYEGRVVANLPFMPIGLIRSFSHNQIQGEDYTQCSAACLFILTLLALRNTIRKMIGIRRPRTREPFTIPFSTKFMSSDENNNWWNSPKMAFIVLTGFYACQLYNLMKQHQSIKYKIAISRNMSRLTGAACNIKIPKFLRPIIYGTFSKMYGINFEEMKHGDLKFYQSFNKFFTRQLKEGVRKIMRAKDITSLCSPCDGRVLTCGEVRSEDHTIDCVKGRSYRLDEFIFGAQENQSETQAVPSLFKRIQEKGNKLFYMVIYLAPSDYHRFHSPGFYHCDFRRHIVGYLDPVKPAYVNRHKDVFKNNERVNLFGKWNFGFFMQSFVGALNVGSIKLNFDPSVRTNCATVAKGYDLDKSYNTKQIPADESLEKYVEKTSYEQSEIRTRDENSPLEVSSIGVEFQKGEEIGCFEMGSTIVLVFEGPANTQLKVHEGMRLWLGQEIVSVSDNSE